MKPETMKAIRTQMIERLKEEVVDIQSVCYYEYGTKFLDCRLYIYESELNYEYRKTLLDIAKSIKFKVNATIEDNGENKVLTLTQDDIRVFTSREDGSIEIYIDPNRDEYRKYLYSNLVNVELEVIE